MNITLPAPPQAASKPYTHRAHGHERSDSFAWLRNPSYPQPVKDGEILNYLKAENEYTQTFYGQLKGGIDTLFQELKGRMKEEDGSVPYQDGLYWYYHRFEKGSQYPIFCRKKGSLDGPEEIILHVPECAADTPYFRIGNLSISPDHRFLAYTVDRDGSERFTAYMKDLEKPDHVFETIDNVFGQIEWAQDNKTFFYVHVDENWRYEKVFRHVLGSDPAQDHLIYHEKDKTFFVHVSSTQNRQYILISSHGHEESEIHLIDAATPTKPSVCFKERAPKIEYSLDQWGDHFAVVINDTGVNSRLITTPITQTDPSHWVELIPHSATRYLTGVMAFDSHLVLTAREGGLPAVYTYDKARKLEKIPFADAAYEVGVGTNARYETTTLRLGYSALGKPQTVMDVDLESKTFTVKKVQEIPSGFDSSLYVVERLNAKARDGVAVPISLIYHKDALKSGPAPLVLYGYGSYGYSMPASFSASRFSLIDRGVVFAIAHIRGGSEMGKSWYEDGKFLKKKNTFYDFIDASKHLINNGYTSRGNIAIWGGSAGGMLIGACLNEAPELFKAAIADVPFVDVLTTMLDTTLPLTTPEKKEWGNPEEKGFYDYILSYSPYDNVKPQVYPHLLVNAGLNDPRVTYWEPAKWVAKLRTIKTITRDDHLLLLKTDMGQGHGGASGRFDSLKEVAEMQAFLLHCFGIAI